MRQSLENIKFIEDFILGNFDPSEHQIAQKRINGSPELSHLLETQQCIYSATRRKALRSEIQSYAPNTSLSFFQQNKYWFIGGLAALTILIGFFIFNSKNELKKQQSPISFQSQISKNEEDVKPWIPFDVQTFSFIAEKGTTILGQDGTLIILGKNALLDVDGNHVSGKIVAELIEAIDWEDMISYNLTTTSDGKALSSGGMMRIRYKQNGKEVFVDPEQPMHVEIPTDDYNPEMKVWEGEVKDDQLDWKNSQELESYLTQIDLRYLDFVPSDFDAEVAAILPYNGHTGVSNRLVDSLYYSISTNREAFTADRESKSSFVNDCYFNIPIRKDKSGHPRDQTKPLLKGRNSVTGQIVDPEGNPISGMEVTLRMDRYLEHEEPVVTDKEGYFTFTKFYPGEVSIYASLHSNDESGILWKYCLESTFECPKNPKNYKLKKPLVAEYSNMVNFDELSVLPKTNGSFIDPLAIKTLKTSRFQNTLIATKEFEQRLQVMHQMKKGAILLETYINNLSKPLWKCDEMAAQLLSGVDRVIFEEFAAQRLTKVQNSGDHQEALMAFYTTQRRAFRKENQRRLNEYQKETSEDIYTLTKEIEKSLDDNVKLAETHAKYKGRTTTSARNVQTSSRSFNARSVRSGSYSFTWASNAWCNIDYFLRTIGPNPWLTDVRTNMSENDLTVYQTVRELQTVIGLVEQAGSYQALSSRSADINEVFCIAMYQEDDQLFYGGSSYNPKSTRDLDLNLVPVTEDEFYLNLCSLAPSQSIIAGRLRADHSMLKAHAKIKKRNAPFTRALDSVKNNISSEVIVYNRLFDFLDGRSTNLVQ